jgi:LPPG:FO 2-phospho-L-lactate transferase
MDALEAAGRPAWFRLGDRDLAMCLIRTEELRSGRSLTEAHGAVVDAMGVGARVLPMADEPVATRVEHGGRLLPFQEYMIVHAAAPPVEGVELDGVERARPTDAVLAALAEAELIVIGPSNPVISIGPILAVPGMRDAIAASGRPVIAVSPFVAGQAVKGPTEKFMAALGKPSTAAAVASLYEGVIQAMVVDADDVRVLSCPTLMEGREGRRELAERVLEFANVLV